MFKLGVIGPEDLVNKSMEVAADYKTLIAHPLPYKNEEAALSLVKENEDAIDGFLFTGFVPYYRVKDLGITSKPLFYYPISGSSLQKALFMMKVHSEVDISKLSIDTLSKQEIEEIYSELRLSSSNIYINQKSLSEFNLEQYVEFHEKLFNSSSTCAAVTAVNSVYEALRLRNIPVFRILPSLHTMKETFALIQSASKTYMAENSQIIIQIISVEDYCPGESQVSGIVRREKRLQLYQELLKYGRKYQVSVFSTEGDEFVLLITRGTFNEYSNFYETMPILSYIEDSLNISASMGIGMGRSALEAEENARQALMLSRKNQGCKAYIINQDKEVWGPIGTSSSMNYSLKSSDERLVELARKANISISTLTQISDLVKRLNRHNISANDIEEGLNVTLRTANRIINKLVEAGIAENVGIEQPAYRGRPRQIYNIKI
jgi:hypothetical protein